VMTAMTATSADFLTKRQTARGREAKPARKVTRRQFLVPRGRCGRRRFFETFDEKCECRRLHA
jgi:hypothetical protein